ncbi:MAG: hypothetical protein H7099_04425 [Gemmatimonadaceae bacterium]|nr:hypothetical protein [Gemmatimonadaceae bacterium]
MTSSPMRSVVACASLALASIAHAQQDTTVRIDEHWRAYLGCWATSSGGVSGPMVCVAPTSAAQTVEFITVVGDSIVSTTPVTASGARVELTRDKCAGWESGRWSLDERRLYTHSEFICPGGSAQKQDGLLTMRYADTFSRIEGVKTRGGARTRVVHFQLEIDSTLYPKSIVSRIPSVTAMPAFGARLEAAADVSPADVVDATKELDASLVEAWLGDRGQKFALGVNELRALHSSSVPESVIDMVVALANPRFFAVARDGAPVARPADPFRRRPSATTLTPGQIAALANDQCLSTLYGGYARCNSSLMNWNDLYFPWYGYPIYRGYSLYSNQFGPYGPIYGNSWYGGSNGGGYVIVPVAPQNPEPPGRVINGQGYSQGGASRGSSAEPRSPSVGSSDFGGSSSSGSSSTGGGGGGGGSAPASTGGGEQRTAKPRP